MTLGFVSMLRFLMAEVAAASHTASVLAFGQTLDGDEQAEEVEVELDDEEGLMQIYMQEPEGDVADFM